MKLTVNRRHLLAAVKTARAFQSRELAKDNPIFGAVELRADAGALVVASAGPSWAFEADVAAEVESDGSALVPAAQVVGVLAAARSTDVTLVVRQPYRLSIDVGAGCATLLDLQEGGPAALPPWPFSGDGGQRNVIDVPVPTLRRLLGRVLHAIDPERANPVVRLSVETSTLAAEATDGHRLVKVATAVGRGPKVAEVIFLDHALAARLSALKSDCSARLLESGGHLLLSMTDGIRIAFRSVELTSWPRTEPIFDAVRGHLATVCDRARLLSIAQAAMAFPAGLSLRRFRGGSFVGLVVSQSAGSGSGVQEDLAASLEGDTAEAVANVSPHFLVDALLAIETNEVRLLIASDAPTAMVGVEPVLLECSAEQQLEVIAPLRDGPEAQPNPTPPEAKAGGKKSRKKEAVDDEAERRKFVDGLLGRGYRRTKPLERLAPGLYDVCIRDGEATVTWWPRAEEA